MSSNVSKQIELPEGVRPESSAEGSLERGHAPQVGEVQVGDSPPEEQLIIAEPEQSTEAQIELSTSLSPTGQAGGAEAIEGSGTPSGEWVMDGRQISATPSPSPSHPSEPPLLRAVEEDEGDDRRESVELTLTSDFRKVKERGLRSLQAFLDTLEEARGSQALIIIKGHPDPDSIASALAQQHFCRAFEIKTSMVYFDEISHPENRALIKALDCGIQRYTPESPIDLSTFQYLCFVDTPDTSLPDSVVAADAERPPTLSLIDHHKELANLDAAFVDIRESSGSTSSIYSEYLEFAPPELSLNRNDSSHALLATALMHGIRTDTDNLLLASSIDFYAAAFLRSFIDRDLLRVISQQSVSARTMEIIQRGLNNKVIKGTFLLAGVEFVREEDRDGIPQTADFLIRHEGVETAVVFGIVNNTVNGSLRTSSATIDPDRWIKETFGCDPQGVYYGGGRRSKGAFQIPLGLWANSPDRRALWKLGERTVRTMIFQKIGEEEDVVQEEGKE
ncbi:MAG: DHH family phosphoesterase [Myxococcota bacterium]|nr:DHH family phosphoesterase [Myxococcota bacterium]